MFLRKDDDDDDCCKNLGDRNGNDMIEWDLLARMVVSILGECRKWFCSVIMEAEFTL